MSPIGEREKLDRLVRRVIKRLKAPAAFPGNPNAMQEFFIITGVTVGVSDSFLALPVIGPVKEQQLMADSLGGIIYWRPVAINAGSAAAAAPVSVPIAEAPPAPDSNWMLVCAECPADYKPAPSPVEQHAVVADEQPDKPRNKSADENKETLSFTYSVEYPCNNTISVTLNQINQSLSKSGLRADMTPKTSAVQIFLRPSQQVK
jgi:hypothetical protein